MTCRLDIARLHDNANDVDKLTNVKEYARVIVYDTVMESD